MPLGLAVLFTAMAFFISGYVLGAYEANVKREKMADQTKAAEWFRWLRFLAERARWDEHNGRLVVDLTDDEYKAFQQAAAGERLSAERQHPGPADKERE